MLPPDTRRYRGGEGCPRLRRGEPVRQGSAQDPRAPHDGSVAAALKSAERTNYDVLGRVTSEEGGTAFSGVTATTWQTLKSRTYTAISKVKTEMNGAGNTTTYVYDELDRAVI